MEREEDLVPASPIAQYFNSSVLTIAVVTVLELEVPIFVDDSQIVTLIYDMVLPINPRFSSVMVVAKNGAKRWMKVEVRPKDHLYVPVFPAGMLPEFYDKCFNDYLTKISMERLPQNRPLWEIHVIKYPTSTAAGSVVFKLHHSLGDGYSLMGALLSCLQKADDPSRPLALPTVKPRTYKNSNLLAKLAKIFPVTFNTVSDSCWSLSKSTFLDDDESPLRSGDEGVESRPMSIVTMAFSLDQIKQTKAKLGVTINDVITGGIFFGVRLYMQEVDQKSSNSKTTSLVLLNTRMLRSYYSVAEMVKPKSKSPWGNHFAFLHISVPKLTNSGFLDPLNFVWEAQKIIKRKRSSFDVYITGKLLEIMRKMRGPEVAAKYIHSTLANASLAITNMVGPMEQSALANHPCKGMYFIVINSPQSLTITALSYVETLRITVGAEKDFIDTQKLKTCIEKAFGEIFKAACNHLSQ